MITMLPTGEATADVMFRQLALQAMRPKSTWIQMATIGVEATEHLVTEARIRRPRVTFVVLASGPQRVAGALESVFKVFGPATLWLGPADAGSGMKLVVNAWLAFRTEGAEAAALAEHLVVPTSASSTPCGTTRWRRRMH